MCESMKCCWLLPVLFAVCLSNRMGTKITVKDEVLRLGSCGDSFGACFLLQLER